MIAVRIVHVALCLVRMNVLSVRTPMIAVRIVHVRNISVDETADILVRCPTWVRE